LKVGFLDRLKDGVARLELQNSTSGVKNLAALHGQHRRTVLHDTSAWNLHPNFMGLKRVLLIC